MEQLDNRAQSDSDLADSESKLIERGGENGAFPSVEAPSEQQNMFLGLQKASNSSAS